MRPINVLEVTLSKKPNIEMDLYGNLRKYVRTPTEVEIVLNRDDARQVD